MMRALAVGDTPPARQPPRRTPDSIRHLRLGRYRSSNYRLRWSTHGPWNHVDHRELSTALPDAAADAANRWLFTDSGEPWGVAVSTRFLSIETWRPCREALLENH
jgi:hypothetical protein